MTVSFHKYGDFFFPGTGGIDDTGAMNGEAQQGTCPCGCLCFGPCCQVRVRAPFSPRLIRVVIMRCGHPCDWITCIGFCMPWYLAWVGCASVRGRRGGERVMLGMTAVGFPSAGKMYAASAWPDIAAVAVMPRRLHAAKRPVCRLNARTVQPTSLPAASLRLCVQASTCVPPPK